MVTTSDERLPAMANRLHRLIDVVVVDIVLRMFLLFVQTAHKVLKYTDAYFYHKR